MINQKVIWWYVCDDRASCLYSQDAVDRMNGDPVRCIKHGAILNSDKALDGLSREQARDRLNRL